MLSPHDTTHRCEYCGGYAWRMYYVGDGCYALLCDSCRDMMAGSAPTLPNLPTVRVFSDLPGCCPSPTPDTWCVAAWLVYLEHTDAQPPLVPSCTPTLCAAHRMSMADLVIRINAKEACGYTDEQCVTFAVEDSAQFVLLIAGMAERLSRKYSNY